jgi:sugar lactone lactonase YvrE
MCWSSGSKEGRVVVGGNGKGQGSNQLNSPIGLLFDRENNLYVADCVNDRIQRFDIDQN